MAHDKKECLQFYRALQVLEKYMNAFLERRIVPVTMLTIPLNQIIGQYVSICLHDTIPMPFFLMFPLIAVDTGVCNVLVFTLASWVHSGSLDVLRKLRRLTCGRRNSVFAKNLKSCSLLKIKFGSNFIDRGTALVIQDFCMNQTANLVMINSSQ